MTPLDIHECSYADLFESYRRRFVDLASNRPQLLMCGLPGVNFLVLLAPVDHGLAFVPDFRSVWWRAARDWLGAFDHADQVLAEVLAAERGRASPFWRESTRWKFPPARRREELKVDHRRFAEFVVGGGAATLHQAVDFLQRWFRDFAEFTLVSDTRHAQLEQASATGHFELMCFSPIAGRDCGRDPLLMFDRLQALTAGMLESQLRDLLRLGQSPSVCCLGAVPERAADWERLHLLRVRRLTMLELPPNYPWIQGQCSRTEWQRELVSEARLAVARGHASHSPEVMRMLHLHGLALERRFPLLGLLAVRQ